MNRREAIRQRISKYREAAQAVTSPHHMILSALAKLREGCVNLVSASEAWRERYPLTEAAATPSPEALKTGDNAIAGKALVTLLKESDAYRDKVRKALADVEDLKIPERADSLENLVAALEAADHMLEGLGDTVWLEFTPWLKAHGYTNRR